MKTEKMSSIMAFATYMAQFFVALSGVGIGILTTVFLLFALSANANPVTHVVPNSEPFPDETFTHFLENLSYITNAQLLDQHGLTRGNASINPWSGSYWPIHKGVIAARYASSTFANSRTFTNNYNSYKAYPSETFVYSGNTEQLSPAEKYDLLVGDSNWTLTRAMWAKGLRDLQTFGVVSGWTGICHGWAAAAHIHPQPPASHVTVRDVTGRYNIKFYANDIKALLSYLWAEASPGTFLAGKRCRQGRVITDSYLRPLDPACLDSNPMTWHLALANRMGLHGMSLVMDSANGPEVWNYPLVGYDYHYFDPKTYMPTHNFKSALRKVSEFDDPYKDHRSPKTAYIVGIIMDTFHSASTVPTRNIATRVVTTKKTFIYDLELDENFELVGGEWYSRHTPDFIWGYSTASRARTREDIRLSNEGVRWNASRSALPPEVARSAQLASQRGQVLSTIADALYETSAITIEGPQLVEEPPEAHEGDSSVEEAERT